MAIPGSSHPFKSRIQISA